jgi:hypothetical protein
MRLTPFLNKLSIRDKARGLISLEPNWAQAEMVAYVEDCLMNDRPIRAIVLKARQLGISTIVEALIFTASFMFHGNKAWVISHEQKSYEHLLAMSKLYWATFPFQSLYTTDYSSRKELAWKETQSSILTSTAKSVESGRSQTIHWLHASEVGFWDDPDTLMTGLRQTIPNVPGTAIFLESTANGVGNFFHTTWQEAEAGDSDYKPFFFPWWKHPEYTAGAIGLDSTMPFQADTEERILRALMREGGIPAGDIKAKLIWRRWAIKNLTRGDLLTFQQEYPATPLEAFVATGNNVFPLADLNVCFQPMKGSRGYLTMNGNEPIWTTGTEGPWTLYRLPSRDADHGRYIVAGDPTHNRGDFACIQVLNRRTWEQVARCRIRTDPINFATDLFAAARYYNDALIVTETTGPGYATIGALMTMNYPHLYRASWADKTRGSISDSWGFATNFQRKHWAIGALNKAIVDHAVMLHDRDTYNECVNYQTLDNGGFGAPRGMNDDTVMSLAIGVLANMTEPLPPEGADLPDYVKQRMLVTPDGRTVSSLTAPVDIDDLIYGDQYDQHVT